MKIIKIPANDLKALERSLKPFYSKFSFVNDHYEDEPKDEIMMFFRYKDVRNLLINVSSLINIKFR
jgi:hypothetical protein